MVSCFYPVFLYTYKQACAIPAHWLRTELIFPASSNLLCPQGDLTAAELFQILGRKEGGTGGVLNLYVEDADRLRTTKLVNYAAGAML